MRWRSIVSALVGLTLVAAACGDDDAATTTTPTSTTTVATTATTVAPTTTAAAPTTTTTLPDGPLGGLLNRPVADPFFGSGFHEMIDEDGDGRHAVSVDGLRATDGDRLVLEPSDADIDGLGPGQVLVVASVDEPADPPSPTATVLYIVAPNGWEVATSVDGDDLRSFLESTTDYQARISSGDAPIRPVVTAFSWTAGVASFTADVDAFRSASATDAAFEGTVECTIAATFECRLISDDGVLRPGDEGEAVEALQTGLEAIGYFDGEIDGMYDDDVVDAVSLFQRDHRLGQDGKAGPNTLEVLTGLTSGESDIVMASQDGVGDVPFGGAAATAIGDLAEIFGTADETTGWYTDECDGNQWNKVSWDGFTAIFTDRDGSRQFDGWHVANLDDIPDWLYFRGGIAPGWTWSNLESLGARFEAEYSGFWFHETLGYNNGRFTSEPGDAPAAGAEVASFGTGTGAFVSC